MYQYVLEGRYSNLPPIYKKDGSLAFWRVAASNEETDFSNVGRLRLALLRRFHHLRIVPDTKEITDYFSKMGGNPMVIAFLLNFPNEMFPHPYDEKMMDLKANPFPCMWESISDFMNENVKISSKDLRAFISSAVGTGAAAKFVGFINLASKLDIEKVIKTPKPEIAKLKKEEESISLLYAIIATLQDRWNRTKLTPLQVEGVLVCLDVEFQTAFLKMLIGEGKGKRRLPKLLEQKGIVKAIEDLGMYLNDEEDE